MEADNIWPGMTIENNNYAHRLDELRACGAKHIWLSLEPLLGPVDQLDFRGVDWVIVGGESGNASRMDRATEEAWVQDVYARCREAGVPMFVKQWGQKAYNPLMREGCDALIPASPMPSRKIVPDKGFAEIADEVKLLYGRIGTGLIHR